MQNVFNNISGVEMLKRSDVFPPANIPLRVFHIQFRVGNTDVGNHGYSQFTVNEECGIYDHLTMHMDILVLCHDQMTGRYATIQNMEKAILEFDEINILLKQ